MSANAEESCQVWACSDCLSMFANGQMPEVDDDEAAAAWIAEVRRRTDGTTVAVGGKHEECANVDANGNWLGVADCSCERRDFSSRSCETCGSQLGGSRHALTLFWPREAATA